MEVTNETIPAYFPDDPNRKEPIKHNVPTKSILWSDVTPPKLVFISLPYNEIRLETIITIPTLKTNLHLTCFNNLPHELE